MRQATGTTRCSETLLHVGEWLRLGRFDCDAGDPRWSSDNQTGPWPLLAFPSTPVEIAQAGHREVVATSNRVMLYNPRQLYRRRLLDSRGDHCLFLAVDGSRLAELGDAIAPALADRGARPFTAAWAPASPDAVLTMSLLVRHLAAAAGTEPDGLVVDESLLHVLTAVLAQGAASRSHARDAARRRELARALERELAVSFRERRSLDELAASVGASPFHAARVFRQHTGLTIHGYRHRLRLQAALERLGSARVDLAALALELGFSSHSHLTEAFRRAFGAPPSHWRGRVGRGLLQELSARLRRPPPREHRARS